MSKIEQELYVRPEHDFGYQQTLMYGRYAKALGEFAKEETKRIKKIEKQRKKEDKLRKQELENKYQGECMKRFRNITRTIWKNTFAKIGEDWVFLSLLGILMAILSFIMDRGIGACANARMWLYRDIAQHPALKYFAWVTLPVILILFSAGFVHVVAPQSIGSGIPEMKTILRGVALKEYLTFRTLVAKVIGLIATLGSGMPLGKEGPLVHMSSIVATLLSKLVTSFRGIYQNESRTTEMLAAACAVGVAGTFAAPIGGVLFSIEVTTVYFAVRNYWRGFFAAVWGATIFRLLSVWFQKDITVRPVFATNFTNDFPYDPQELIAFAIIGFLCGVGGALFVLAHRTYVLFIRKSQKVNQFLQKNRFIYPGVMSLIVASACFPLGPGQFMAATLSNKAQVVTLFSNFSWTKDEFTVAENEVIRHWSTEHSGVFLSLSIFIIYQFIFCILASTIPVPSGMFVPVFKIGAAIGRIVGELMNIWFPNGVRVGPIITPIIPGGYATVGAAAFSGAVTRTISVSVIAVEMTGQITHIIPIMIAVLISNATMALLQPSIYDSIILIKKLPYLPDLLPSSSNIYNVYVEDFMVREVKYVWYGMTYKELRQVLQDNKQLRSFPLVDKQDSMVLLGSMQRVELIRLISKQIGRQRRMEMAAIWHRQAEERAMELERQRIEMERRQRRPSRFEVTPAPDVLKLRRTLEGSEPRFPFPYYSGQPKKSILKKTNSFTVRSLTPYSPYLPTPPQSHYSTITGAESRMRLAFEAIFRKSATLQDVNPDPEMGDNIQLTPLAKTLPRIEPSSGVSTPTGIKKVTLPLERVIDMSPEDQRRWEDEEMSKEVNFESSHIDPAPFQLVERTSLLKTHSLFSMIGINHAYVTAIGRLIGVVGLRELRKGIEDANAGLLPVQQDEQTEQEQTKTVNADEEAEVEDKLLKNGNNVKLETQDEKKNSAN